MNAAQEGSEEETIERAWSACHRAGGVNLQHARFSQSCLRSAGNEEAWATLVAKVPVRRPHHRFLGRDESSGSKGYRGRGWKCSHVAAGR